MLKMKIVRMCSRVLVLVAVSLVGCTKNEDPRSEASRQPQPAHRTSSSTTSSNALPATQGEFPGITVAVQELKRGTNTVTLKLVMTNQSSQSFAAYFYFHEAQGGSVDGIHLIDPVAKKKYFVVKDSDGACLCSRSIQGIVPGAQSVFWAKFPAPADDVQKLPLALH